LLTHWVRPLPDETHQVDRNLYLLESVGVPIAGRRLELNIPESDRYAATALLRDAGIMPGDPFIVIAPGASCAARRYDPRRMGQAARLLAKETRMPIVVVGAERDTEVSRPVIEQSGARSLVGLDTVARLAAILARTSLFVGNNSGPMHLADAFATPSVILYSGTEMLCQWNPRSSPSRLLRRDVSCSPCYHFRCPYAMECLDIAPEEVANAALDLLAEQRTLSECESPAPVREVA
jgi:ADP-heptose:LPS heptosyltransferase